MKYLGVLVVLVIIAAALYKLGLVPTQMQRAAEEAADVAGQASESAKDKLQQAGVDLEAIGVGGPPGDAVDVYKRYAEALGEQQFPTAVGLSVGSAQEIAHQRGKAMRTLESGARDAIRVAKSKQPRRMDRGEAPFRRRAAYNHTIMAFEVLDHDNIVKLDTIQESQGGINPGRWRHLATVMKIQGQYRVTEFTELRAPPPGKSPAAGR